MFESLKGKVVDILWRGSDCPGRYIFLDYDPIMRAIMLRRGDGSSFIAPYTDTELINVETVDNVMKRPLPALALPTRAMNLLEKAGCSTLGDIVNLSESSLRKLMGVGDTTVDSIKKVLAMYDQKMKD